MSLIHLLRSRIPLDLVLWFFSRLYIQMLSLQFLEIMLDLSPQREYAP